jgi:O-methyltransferase involved in polyketide biosynthesis
MRIAITDLTPVELTAFVTQYARALDSRWPRPILGDTLADDIVAKIDYDFDAMGVPSSAVRQTALRATVDWYSVDLPKVIALRDELVPAADHAYSVAASLADDSWTERIPSHRPTVLIADGLLAFLPEPVIVGLFRRIPEYFSSGEVAMNDYGRVSWLNIAAIKTGFSVVETNGPTKVSATRTFRRVGVRSCGWSRRPACPTLRKSTCIRRRPGCRPD